MFSISGYQTNEQLYESAQSLIFRATRDSDGRPVILKVLKDERPPPERIARFKREYQLVQTLALPGVVKAYDFLHAGNHWLFVQEDFGGESLARLNLAGQIETAEFLDIAEQVARHVAAIHQQSIIHKDLNPANIVLNRDSGVVKLIDFGIATQLSRETIAFDHASRVEGTPAYLSPEQTGRINQPLDHRTDMYSLGCTFYELLTGHPPFAAADLIELLHCHLARVPEPVLTQRPDLPPILSAMINKLLAKNAGDRYQSARGLHADLRRCREKWHAKEPLDVFALGRQDMAQRLSPPAQLHGRNSEIAELVDTFERVAGGGTELLLISGHPGVGKSALAKELYQPVTRGRGFFVSGKFDQFQRDTPYQPIIQALDHLVGQVLMEPAEQMATWAAALQAAAGDMLAALVEILPRLELLYERLPPVPALPITEFNARFTQALAGCVRVFADGEHPLVMFVDDLQWADGASLDFIESLLTGEPIPHLLILGTYRHNEVPPGHPLRATLRDIRESGAVTHELHLEPLGTEDTTALIADILHLDPGDIRESAAVIHHKTDGNPFFIQTVLETLTAEGVLYVDHDTSTWQWHADRLRLLELSDNVVDVVIANLQKLPATTRALLTQAACIGNHFDLGLLAAVAGQTPGEVAAALMPALKGNYLIPTTGNYRLLEADIEAGETQFEVAYKFAHDRIQQAAYRLGEPGSHPATHLRIGRIMRTHFAGASADSQLLTMVNQLNQARHLITDAVERHEIAALNLDAGKKAQAAVAHAAAREYCEQGLVFLDDAATGDTPGEDGKIHLSESGHGRAFQSDYRRALALTEVAADAAYLTADFATMNRHIDAVLHHADTLLDRVKAMQIRINAQGAQNELVAAIASAREILDPLGIALPVEPTEADVEAQLQAVTRALGTRNANDLTDLPDMQNAESKAAMSILSSIYIAAFLAQPRLSPVIAAHMVLLSLRDGLAEESIHGFVFYGMTLCARAQESAGNEFGCLAETLVEKRQRKNLIPVVAVMGWAYIFHWQRPLREAIPKMREGYRAGVETGQIEMGSNSLQGSSTMGLMAGCDLPQLDQDYAESARALTRLQQGPYLTWIRQWRQVVRNLRGLSNNPIVLQGDVYDEVEETPIHKKNGDLSALYALDFDKMILCYHFHDHHQSLQSARAIEKGNQPGSVYFAIAEMYRCLASLATHDDAGPEEQRAIVEEARPLVESMKRWGERCPTNYGHKYHLMAAELHRVCGQDSEARAHYDLAADLARAHEFTHEEGLAFERAALFYLGQGNPRLAGYYMRDAYHAFERWGAAAKLAFLRRNYSYLLEHEDKPRTRLAAPASDPGEATGVTTTTGEFGTLDLGTVLAATRTIAGQTDVGTLLQTIMRVSLENAGAERGHLIVVRDDRLLVKVRGELGENARFESISLALGDVEGLAHSVVQYVARTAEPVILDHAAEDGMFVHDPHIRDKACKSVLCLPILNQGSLVAITYLENNRATAVFNKDRLDVLTLLMGQAAVSLESALLKDAGDAGAVSFCIGGSVPADSPTYVRRKADTQLASNIKDGSFCYVFNSRQMGKSSLRVHAVDQLARAGVACVSIDLTSIGSRQTTAPQWYAGIARTLVAGLGLQNDIPLRRWWRDREELSPVQRLDLLVDEEILTRVKTPIAVFVDEVDAVLGLDFSADDFFALLRLFHNRRAEDDRYHRLTVILLGVATPGDLIRDKRLTPFNIGQAIPLSGFRFDEARNLLPALSRAGDGERLLRAVLDWTCGQPFLTQKLCHLITEDESQPPAGKERTWVADLVRARVIDRWRHHDQPEHLRTIEARILNAPEHVGALLTRYREILERGEIETDDSPVETALILSGLVTRTFDRIRVGNPIYAAVFNQTWIEAGLARGQSKRSPYPVLSHISPA